MLPIFDLKIFHIGSVLSGHTFKKHNKRCGFWRFLKVCTFSSSRRLLIDFYILNTSMVVYIYCKKPSKIETNNKNQDRNGTNMLSKHVITNYILKINCIIIALLPFFSAWHKPNASLFTGHQYLIFVYNMFMAYSMAIYIFL